MAEASDPVWIGEADRLKAHYAEQPETALEGAMKPRRFVRMFKPRFAALVKSGAKLQTIRPTPKRMPRPGDILDARQWSGKPYRSKQIKLGEFIIANVAKVELRTYAVMMEFKTFTAAHAANTPSADAFARADGFTHWGDMLAWFEREHGLPFDGILILWTLK